MPAANTSHASSKGQVFGYVGVADGGPRVIDTTYAGVALVARRPTGHGASLLLLLPHPGQQELDGRLGPFGHVLCRAITTTAVAVCEQRLLLVREGAVGRTRNGPDTATDGGHGLHVGGHAGVESAGSVNCLHQVYPQNGGEIDMDSATDVASSSMRGACSLEPGVTSSSDSTSIRGASNSCSSGII